MAKESSVEEKLPIGVSRADLIQDSAKAFASFTLANVILTGNPDPASARGRATLEQAYDRYTPRILAGRDFFSKDLRNAIAGSDWKAIKAATSDPPKKTKADRVKPDGGVSERAAQAGGFSDARVITACELYAATFSDNSVSEKTKKMKVETEGLRTVVQGMNLAARQALGEEKAAGGLFGIGAKKPTEAELQQTVRKLYVEGGNYWNQYIFYANEGLPITLTKLPYL
eukprot:CAMPEP_0195512154 /NCGR_PEP_ID=MMETSP0794_2-20130614/4212_1 /TAXON_ID=515487 /ORGANISM="Stephanopyxis turris, Strain CCMP 815" /LENGTH=227 /DNA_ID=CAMNT_0040639877 /DNA_START=196 /DNA_END=879 /DNA_ORIENTATION=+